MMTSTEMESLHSTLDNLITRHGLNWVSARESGAPDEVRDAIADYDEQMATRRNAFLSLSLFRLADDQIRPALGDQAVMLSIRVDPSQYATDRFRRGSDFSPESQAKLIDRFRDAFARWNPR